MTEKEFVLVDLMNKDKIPKEILFQHYSGPLSLVKALLGVIPNCDQYLEIWSPSFRAYNIMVPNFLNLPQLLLGFGVSKEIIGLAMYVSSRSAKCMYCSAHTCTFAIRRGTSINKIASSFLENDEGTENLYDPKERAVIEASKAIGSIPHSFSALHVNTLKLYYSDTDIEWIMLGTCMMGFLNKMMDGLGIPLEEDCFKDVNSIISPSGWSGSKHYQGSGANKANESSNRIPLDSFWTILRILPYIPNALYLEYQWTSDIPSGGSEAICSYLQTRFGYSFQPLLSKIRQPRVMVALTAMLKENLTKENSKIGLSMKVSLTQLFILVLDEMETPAMTTTEGLQAMNKALMTFHHLDSDSSVEEIKQLKEQGIESSLTLTPKEKTIMLLGERFSYSPVMIDEHLFKLCEDHLTSEELIEVASWMSMLHMLYRLFAFYDSF